LKRKEYSLIVVGMMNGMICLRREDWGIKKGSRRKVSWKLLGRLF